MVLVGLLLLLKGYTLLVDFSLSKDTGLDEDLLLPLGLEVHLHSIISLLRVLALFFRAIVGIAKLLLDFRIKLKGWLLLFRPKYPLGHLTERSSSFVSEEVVIHEHFDILALLRPSAFTSNLNLSVLSHDTVFLLEKLGS